MKSSLSDKLNKAYASSESSGEQDYKKYAKGVPVPEEESAPQPPKEEKVIKTSNQESHKESSNRPFQESQQESFNRPVQESQPIRAGEEYQQERPNEDNFKTLSGQPAIEQEPVQESRPEPHRESYQEPARESKRDSRFGNFDMLSNEDRDSTVTHQSSSELNEQTISSIIDVYNAYSEMSDSEKKYLVGFLGLDSDESAKVIYAVHTLDKSSLKALTSLVKLYNEDGVTRAFELMSMDEDELYAIEDIVLSISRGSTVLDMKKGKINYCKSLESTISKISSTAMRNLIPIGSLLEKGMSL